MIGFFYGQTQFNMLKNSIHLGDYVNYAKENGYKFLTITDENMFGYLKFYKECQKKGIKPIIGLEVKISSSDSFENYILLYAIDMSGFHNLLKVASMLKLNKEVFDLKALKPYSLGLIFVSAGQNCDINRLLCNDLHSEFKKRYDEYQSIFQEVYLGFDAQRFSLTEKNNILYQYAINNNLPLLPIHQTLYLEKDDKEVYEALTQIAGHPRKITENNDFSFPSSNSLIDEFKDYPKAFNNLESIIDNISISFDKLSIKLPTYPHTLGLSSHKFLEGMCQRGLIKRLNNLKDVNPSLYEQRLIYELSVINKMGFDDYFLIVWDFVKYAKQNGILVGPGRGSAAGSLVAYCLGITNVDPIKYDLLFERFLNPERISMPDIDMDFPDDRRDEVISYVQSVYGKNRVCNISAFGTFLVKSSIRDLGRIYKISNERIEILIDMAENNTDEKLLFEKIKENEEIYKLLRIAKKIENLPRHISTHAAGIILSEESLFDIIPLQEGINGLYQSQLEAFDLESLGLLKIDFLGIRNLAIINNTISEIPDLDLKTLNNIPLNDKKTFELFRQADTLGIFQLESTGIKKVLMKLQPTEFEDIVAVLALYRPGPMDNIDEFIARKNGKKFNYLHPLLEPILKNTYGIIVYQEQIMKIATTFAGYRLGEADLLRRAVSKKDEGTLIRERLNFVEHSMNKGYSEKVANEIYDYIVKFANYGFNRSHSVAYALVSYQMAYLKANHFPIFMTKIMNNVIGSQSALASYIKYSNRNNLKILSPSINASTTEFYITKYGLFFPLQGIFTIGVVVAQEIIKERQKGLFKSFGDFKMRMPSINNRVLESLIYAGAFDIFGKTKKSLINDSLSPTESFNKYLDDIKDIKEEYDFNHLKEREYIALGINIKYDIFMNIKKLQMLYKSVTIAQMRLNIPATFIGIFESIRLITTKKNEKMAVLVINDNNQVIDGVIFASDYMNIYNIINKNNLFLITGTLMKNTRDNKLQIKVNNLKKITSTN